MGGGAPRDVTLSHLQVQEEQSEGQCPLTAMFNAALPSPQPALLLLCSRKGSPSWNGPALSGAFTCP